METIALPLNQTVKQFIPFNADRSCRCEWALSWAFCLAWPINVCSAWLYKLGQICIFPCSKDSR